MNLKNLQRLAVIFVSVLLLGATSVPMIQVNAGKLTMQAQDAPMGDILSALGRQIQLTTLLVVDDNSFQRALVTASFSDLPLERGINRILRDWSYILIKNPKTGGLKIFILGRRSISEPIQESEPPVADQFLPQPTDEKELLVHETEKFAGDTGGENQIPSPPTEEGLRSELQSANPQNRLAALEKVLTMEVGDLSGEVRQLVEQDPDPRVRAAALDSLIHNDTSEEAVQVLNKVANGSDPALREIAVEHLQFIEDASRTTANVAHEPKY